MRIVNSTFIVHLEKPINLNSLLNVTYNRFFFAGAIFPRVKGVGEKRRDYNLRKSLIGKGSFLFFASGKVTVSGLTSEAQVLERIHDVLILTNHSNRVLKCELKNLVGSDSIECNVDLEKIYQDYSGFKKYPGEGFSGLILKKEGATVTIHYTGSWFITGLRIHSELIHVSDSIRKLLDKYKIIHRVGKIMGSKRSFKSLPIILEREATLPIYGTEGAAGLDVFATEDVVLTKGKQTQVSIGFSVAIPKGHVGLVLPRSSLTNKMIDVKTGVLDSDFRGKPFVFVYNYGEQDVFIKRNNAIAQIVFLKYEKMFPKLELKLPPTERGLGCLGSTNDDMMMDPMWGCGEQPLSSNSSDDDEETCSEAKMQKLG